MYSARWIPAFSSRVSYNNFHGGELVNVLGVGMRVLIPPLRVKITNLGKPDQVELTLSFDRSCSIATRYMSGRVVISRTNMEGAGPTKREQKHGGLVFYEDAVEFRYRDSFENKKRSQQYTGS
ncbi:hypothetical protein OIU74_021811 [Salix koriyanagi]|uniref:Uncharacterized protein n=1 Tax=Salix koriyanagi TaxID=2511006 RepID=A0A9Q0WJQ5_9ROSI|nr:hypothetical protein OIU74_021811 [Salix koriyanagi]